MKKAIGIALALAISLSAVGCTAFDNIWRRNTSPTPSPTPTVTSTAKARSSTGSTDVPGNTGSGGGFDASGEIVID